MSDGLSLFWKILEIVWINVLISGDNAIMIALACRGLPEEKRHLGVVFGAAGAVALRIAFTLIVVEFLAVPYLRILGGLFVISIATKLPLEETDNVKIDSQKTLLGAVVAIVAADAVMSLDNVLAIAAAAKGSKSLIVFGLVLSAPLVVFGASFLMSLVERYPILVWGGAAVLGWAGGELIGGDSIWTEHGLDSDVFSEIIGAAGCAFVLLVAATLSVYKSVQAKKQQDFN
jgi:YjbE family integral membrane protein